MRAVESYVTAVETLRVSPGSDPAILRRSLEELDFDHPTDPEDALELILGMFEEHQTHTASPRYFGLFDPATATMGVVAETLVAAFNPQLAVWRQSPAAVEIEQFMMGVFAGKFGFDAARAAGSFTSGGSEANHTAVLAALAHAFPEWPAHGLRALSSQPVLYISAEGHHSIMKAARACGLGLTAVREIAVDPHFRLDIDALSEQLARDKAEGLLPFMIVGTAGTTNAGMIDPLAQLADIAARERMWLHVDAAWGGAIALVPEMRHLIAGIERADSITFDPHKWLSVPRGAGLFLTRHRDILARTFQVSATYVPDNNVASSEVLDLFSHSMQWSRRFTGLKTFMTLAVAGWDGYAAVIRRNTVLSRYLRDRLEGDGWSVVNDGDLAVLCFIDTVNECGASAEFLRSVRESVVSSGAAWISYTCLAGRVPALRACVVNFRTAEKDVDALIEALHHAREGANPRGR